MAPDRDGELSKHETDVLLGLYSGCECLWNTKSADYHVKAIRLGAFRTIVNGMRLEVGKDLTVEKVQSLLLGLQSVYEKELQKVVNGESNPDSAYKSEWRWFFFLDSFIRNHVLQKDSQPEPVSSKDISSSSTTTGAGVGGDDNTEDDADCGADSAGENMLDTPSRQTSVSSSRPVRASSRRQRAARVINGDGDSDDDDSWQPSAASRHSPRKKQKTSASNVVGSVRESPRRSGGSRTGAGSSRQRTKSEVVDSVSPDSVRISTQIADTLRNVQTLLAKTLSDHDQPSMVFARHITNELDLIPDYLQRKQCMLDIQRVILRYQTGQRRTVNVKAEHGSEGGGKDSGAVVVAAEPANSSEVQYVEESLPLYFDLQSG